MILFLFRQQCLNLKNYLHFSTVRFVIWEVKETVRMYFKLRYTLLLKGLQRFTTQVV